MNCKIIMQSIFERKYALNKRTHKRLRSDSIFESVEMSLYNHIGYFHRVDDKNNFNQMKTKWEELRSVPLEWIAKGKWPGIWMAMESPHNTYTLHHGDLQIVRFYFKSGFCVYDPESDTHIKTWK